MDELKQLANPETVAGSIAGVAGLWLLVKKAIVKNAVENANLSATDAYSDVINTLRNEVARLSDVNTKLSKALTDLQTENIRLNREISQLHSTVNSMRDRMGIISLRATDVERIEGQDRRQS